MLRQGLRRYLLPSVLLLLASWVMGACAPTARLTLVATDAVTMGPPRDLSVLDELDRTAWRIWLAMESGRLQVDRYDTLALMDLSLPAGVRWTLQDIDATTYQLGVEEADGGFRIVTESGVEAR